MIPRNVLEIRCLGPFEVRCSGEPIPLHRHSRAQMVLKLLAVHRSSPVQREQLVDAMWPDVPLAAGLDSLNTAVSTLRRDLCRGACAGTAPFVLFRDGCYVLNPEAGIVIDIDRFEHWSAEGRRLEQAGDAAAARSAYERTVGLYRGDLLPGEVYRNWTVMERERLLSMHLTALGRLVRLYVEAGHYARAIDSGFQLLGRDPCREDIHRIIMRCYCHMGQRSRALRHYEMSAKVLHTQLGLAPDDALQDLRASIGRGEAV